MKHILKFAIIFLLSIVSINPHAHFPKVCAENEVLYTGEIEHVFTHPLIVYPEIAYAENNPMAKYYKQDCITSKQFAMILNELYKNNYILINATDIFEIKDGKTIKKPLYLPPNKKPLIFSFDDVNYDRKKLGKGMVDKLCLASDGSIVASACYDGKDLISTKEFVSILDDFVIKHPDFSHNGAKGMICLTGYDGILGYRTNRDSKNKESEIVKASALVSKLKSSGWIFACHSYGHYHMTKIDENKFASELEKWKNEVEPIIGKTQIYVYPYGEWEILKDGKFSSKHKMLVDSGFKLFCGVGMKNFFSYLPAQNSADEYKVLFMDRKNIDGFTLNNRKKELKKLFNCDLVK